MRMAFITPADRDVTGAPNDGTLYFDSKLGSSLNPGTSAAAPKRFFTNLPGTAVTGGKYYFRNGRQYRPEVAPPVYGPGQAQSTNMQGTSGSRTLLSGWGAGSRAFIGGDMPLGGWGAVSNSHGNSYLATNGQQVSCDPQVGVFHGHYIGDDMLTPSFWSPACPADPSTVCRFEFYASYSGALVGHLTPAAAVQNWPSTSPASEQLVTRDMALAALDESVTFNSTAAIAGEFYTTTVYIKHPRIAEWYGASGGPVGAVVVMRTNPSNFPRSFYITAYDQATSTITAVTNGETAISSGRIRPTDGCEWWILGHPYDIRQPGQYACILPVSGNPQAWRVRGSWQRGQSTVSRWPTVINLTGSHYDVVGVDFGRPAGRTRRFVDLTGSAGITGVAVGSVNLTATDLILTNCELRQGWADSAESHAGGNATTVTATNIGVRQSWSMGGWRGGFRNGTITGATVVETGRTGLYFSSSGITSMVISDVLYGFANSFHGNGNTFYDRSQNCTIQQSAGLDGVRFYTQQQEGEITPPRNLQLKDSLVLAVRDVSTSLNAPISDYMIRSDNGFQDGLMDRIIAPDGDSLEFFRLIGSGAPNDDAILRRSYFSYVNAGSPSNSCAATKTPTPGAPVEFRDVTIGRGETNITARGATATRVTYQNEGDWTGALTEQMWKELTKTAADHTLYETATLGAARWNWTIPAYNDANPTPGAPVALQISRSDYFVKTQAGKVITHIIGARPMSVLSLPSGVQDNNLFILDQGRVVNLAPMAVGPLTIAVDETPYVKTGGVWVADAGNVRRTTFQLIGRR